MRIPVCDQFQNHQLGIRGDEAALRIGGVTEPLTAEDFTDESDNRIVLPGPRQASCLRLKSSRGEVLVSHLPGQGLIALGSFGILSQMFKLAGFLPFWIEITELAPNRRGRIWIDDASLAVENNNALRDPGAHAVCEGRRRRSRRCQFLQFSRRLRPVLLEPPL